MDTHYQCLQDVPKGNAPSQTSTMLSETYLNHPTFGLLFSLCVIEQNSTLYTTLYAQRLFFIATTSAFGLEFESIGRLEARRIVETRLRTLRRAGSQPEYDQLQVIHQQTFQ